MTRTIELFFLSELNAFRLLWRGVRRRPSAVIGLRPLWPALSPGLARVAAWAERRHLCRPIGSLIPGSDGVGRDLLWEDTYDVFRTVEPWAETHLRFGDAAGDYAMAFKHTVCGYLNASNQALFDLRVVDQSAAGRKDVCVVGADEELLGVYEAYFGRPLGLPTSPGGTFRRLLNMTSLAAVLFSCLTATVRRSRLRVRREEIFLGWDFGASKPLVRLLGEMVDDPGDAMIVFRNTWMAEHYRDWATQYRRCTVSDGRFTIAQGIAAIGMVIRHLRDLNRRFGYLSPALFRLTMALVYRRVITRALLNRYRFRYFWSHDDYNVEHIIRSQEIRRIGGRSLGINHGMAVPEGISPMWRYVDFDIYYVFGTGFYEKFNKATWAPGMTVKGVGSYGMSREQLTRVGDPRPPNIVFFFNMSVHENEMIDAVVEVAEVFPDRKVFAKVKPSRKSEGRAEEISWRCAGGPSNLVETREDSYELMLKCRYALSSQSTIVAESVQFGLRTFVFDFTPDHRYTYYREFPGLTVRSSDEVIGRIRSIESGSSTYARDDFGLLIDLSGKVIFDVIRSDLGLPEKQPGFRMRIPDEAAAPAGVPKSRLAGESLS